MEKPPWTEFRFYGSFDGQLRELLHRAKFQSEPAVLRLLGCLLADICAELPEPDAIVPMPLHPGRLRFRGYNQCREIALVLSRERRIPIRHDWLCRTRATAPQTALSRQSRLHNLKGAFRVADEKRDHLRDKHILLVDDITTTGASLHECAKTLLASGVAKVDVAVIASAPLHHPFPVKG